MSTRFPLPDLDFAATRPFFEAASRHELAIPRCRACGAWSWYPRATCPQCGGSAWRWPRLSGRAELYSFAVVERAFAAPFTTKVPFVAALVVPEEAPEVRIATNVVNGPIEAVEIGMKLQAVFLPLRFQGVAGSVMAPFFEGRDSEAAPRTDR